MASGNSITVQVDLAREAAKELREAVRDANLVLREMQSARRDLVALLEVIQDTERAGAARLTRSLDLSVQKHVKALGDQTAAAMEAATAKVAYEFERLADMYLKGNGDGDSLFDIVKTRNKMLTLAGWPITSAAEPLRKGEVIVKDGVEYVMGADAFKIGTLLYQNKIDGKLYPGPDVEMPTG